MEQSQKCSICLETKPASDFYVSGKYLYSHCKVCKREKDKNTYQNNESERDRRKRNEKISHRVRHLKARLYVYGILVQSKCLDCCETRFETLDFDHVRGSKDRNISQMVRKGLPIKDIENEISKCEIRCANCHRIRTSEHLGWARTNWSAADDAAELRTLQENVGKRKL